MNSEESRLRSYSIWSITAPVSPRNLSANGFFATGNLFEVECNWCHCRINNWEYSDDIEERHIQLNPQCEFIINKHNCGNLPINMTSDLLQQLREQNDPVVNENPTSTTKEQPTLDLLIEKDRLATFVNWPNPNITPQSLAKAGFFYRNRSDEVECAWCKGVIAQWEKQDNAFEEHRRFFPECPRVLLGPLIEIANDGIRDLGIQQISAPKNPKYSSLHARLRTYSNWPIEDIQKPEDLAQAGLYYQKVDDQVRCFHCNMGLRSWEKEDDPWFEHAKWYPMCDFVRLVKGANYIQEVQELTRTAQTSDVPFVPIAIEDAMKTEPVKHALEMGIDCDTLRYKTEQQISQTGSAYKTVEDLLKAVFDDQDNISSNSQSTIETSNSNNYQSSIGQNDVLNSLAVSNNEVLSPTSINVENMKYDRASNSTKALLSSKDINSETSPEALKNILESTENVNGLPRSDTNEKSTSDRKFLEEENRKLKDARLCKVCLDEEVGVVYLPCGHLVTCVQCAPGVNQCPMCRTTIKGFVRTYLS